jgi:hypothetical protein
VPLSEEEQRILHELEQKLYEHDPAFVERVRARSGSRLPNPRARWLIGSFVVGFVILLVAFQSSTLVATVGLAIMVVSGLLAERHLHHLDSSVLGHPFHRSSAGSPDGSDSLPQRFSSKFKRDR